MRGNGLCPREEKHTELRIAVRTVGEVASRKNQ